MAICRVGHFLKNIAADVLGRTVIPKSSKHSATQKQMMKILGKIDDVIADQEEQQWSDQKIKEVDQLCWKAQQLNVKIQKHNRHPLVVLISLLRINPDKANEFKTKKRNLMEKVRRVWDLKPSARTERLKEILNERKLNYRDLKRIASSQTPDLLHKLGLMYYYGMGTKIDHKKAKKCFKTAAEVKYLPSVCMIAQMQQRKNQQEKALATLLEVSDVDEETKLIQAKILSKDSAKEAEEIYKSLAHSGKREALYEYAKFLDGQRRFKEASKFYEQASAKGDKSAAMRLFKLYMQGRGSTLKKDQKKAIDQLLIAVSQGSQEAAVYLTLLANT